MEMIAIKCTILAELYVARETTRTRARTATRKAHSSKKKESKRMIVIMKRKLEQTRTVRKVTVKEKMIPNTMIISWV